MTSFRENAANVDEGRTVMKRVQNGALLNDVGVSINGTTPANIAPLPILLRLERVAAARLMAALSLTMAAPRGSSRVVCG